MENKNTILTLKDHSVSGETFSLIESKFEGILKTHPQPKAEDLSKYYESEDYISHTDTKRNMLEQVYHLIRKRTLRQKLKLINSFSFQNEHDENLGDKKLLDVGCGTGDFLKIAKEYNWSVFGIEPNPEARKIANSKTNENVFDVSKLEEIEANSFNIITLWHVLEHLPDLEAHIKTFNHLLKPNGYLVIAVPNHKSYDAKYYKTFWAAFDVPRHLWHFSQSGISRFVESFGFKKQNTFPMRFDAFYVSLLSEKYKSGYMNPFKAFWLGLRSNRKAKSSGEYSSLIYSFKKTKN